MAQSNNTDALSVGDTVSFRSAFSDAEKQRLKDERDELRRLLDRTANSIERTKKHIKYLERLKIWTERNLYEMGQE